MTNRNDLLTGSVPRCIIRMALPMMIGMLSIVMYNLGDTYFVGKLGKDELAAISFTFPVVMILGSIAFGLGIGVSSLISTAIGAGNYDKVKRYTTDVLLLGVILAGVFSVTGFLVMDTLFSAMGADGVILKFIREYMSIWFLGSIFVVVPMIGNNAIRASGDTRTPAIVMTTSGVLNLILDPVLMFGIGPFPEMGIRGAAMATLVSRAITLVVALYVLGFREKMLSSKIPSFSELMSSWKDILHIGLPEAFTRIVMPLANGIITKMVAGYGVAAVAGFGVAVRVEFFALLPIFSVAAVIAPFVGQNLGAKKLDRIVSALRFAVIYSLITGVVIFALSYFFASDIASIFNNDKEVIRTASIYMVLVSAGYGFFGVVKIFAGVLNVFRKPLLASLT
ncbi:MAG: MATE family efflux transporter, partial [Candidatus Muiribacteriaceae bacterium]